MKDNPFNNQTLKSIAKNSVLCSHLEYDLADAQAKILSLLRVGARVPSLMYIWFAAYCI